MNNKLNMLIVDDQEANIEYLKSLFVSDYNIYTGKSGKEGLQLLQTEKIDILLLDIVMPEMNGIQVIKAIRADEKLFHLPIIAVTAESEFQHEALKAGASEFVAKPVESEVIQIRVRNVMSRTKLVLEKEKTTNLMTEVTKYKTKGRESVLGTYHECYDKLDIACCIWSISTMPNGKEDAICVYGNNAFAKEEGKALNEIVGKYTQEIYNGKKSRFLNTYKEVAYTGIATSVENFSEPLQKHLKIQCHQPLFGMCACILEDITQKVNAERALRETKLQLENILKNIPGGVCMYKLEKGKDEIQIVTISDGLCELLGKSKEEITQSVTNGMYKLIDKEDLAELSLCKKENIDCGKDFSYTYKLNISHENTKYILLNVSCRREIDGSILVYAVFTDVTVEREAHKQAVERYNEVMRYSANAEPNALIFYRVNLTSNNIEQSVARNPLFEHLTKHNKVAELVNDCVQSVYVKDVEIFKNVVNVKNLLKQYNKGISEVEVEYRRDVGDGKMRWLKMVLKLLAEPSTSDVLAYSYVFDINREKITSEVLTEAVSRDYDYISYIDSQTRSYVMHISERSGAFQPPNEGMNFNEDFAKCSQKFMLSSERKNVLVAVDLDKVVKELASNENYFVYYTSIERDGSIAKKKLHFYYRSKEDGKIVCAQSDITHIYEEEEKTKDILKNALALAEEASNAKSKFLSNMSHDIRTPMNAIVGMTELAFLDLKDEKAIKDDLKVIQKSANHLLVLINDVLEMSKIESGKLVTVSQSIDLDELKVSIEQLCRPMFQEKEQSFFMREISVKNKLVLGDELRLRRVLINLLNNASKFTPKGGEIVISMEERSSDDHYAKYRFIISDNGIGISKAKLKEIFAPFVRVSDSIGNQIEGTGLGLSIVKNSIEAMGGAVWVESEEGVGSRFVIELSLKIDEAKSPLNFQNTHQNEEINVNPLQNLKVLIVEDHKINQIVAEKLFTNCGSFVTIANDGLEGLKIFKESSEGEFDAIFMDVQMPEMNGYEATKEIRALPRADAKTIPILAMTANAFSDDVAKSLSAGMNAHISKPIRIENISLVLGNLIKKK